VEGNQRQELGGVITYNENQKKKNGQSVKENTHPTKPLCGGFEILWMGGGFLGHENKALGFPKEG